MEDKIYDEEALSRIEARSKRNEATGCLEWQGLRADGYGAVMYKSRRYYAHRLSYHAHRGPIPLGLLVCHTCDNPCCVEIGHLFLGTPTQNSRDRYQKGRRGRPRSKMCRTNAKITEADAAEIKRRLLLGQIGPVILEEMALPLLTLAIISTIRRGTAWADVEPAKDE